jgi:hypothetical protein
MLLNDFYADPRRASSEEVDFGPSWRTNGEGPWKVLWVQATGEIVAFLESASAGFAWSGVGGGGGGGGGGNLLAEIAVGFVFDAAVEGVIGAFRHGAQKPHPELDEVVIIGREPDLLRLRGALLNWEEHMPEPNGLGWLAERVDELSPGHAV